MPLLALFQIRQRTHLQRLGGRSRPPSHAGAEDATPEFDACTRSGSTCGPWLLARASRSPSPRGRSVAGSDACPSPSSSSAPQLAPSQLHATTCSISDQSAHVHTINLPASATLHSRWSCSQPNFRTKRRRIEHRKPTRRQASPIPWFFLIRAR